MASDTERLIRLAARLASPGQLPGSVCCLMAVGILGVVEAVLVESDFRIYFSSACAVTFCIGLIGIANPILRLLFWR